MKNIFTFGVVMMVSACSCLAQSMVMVPIDQNPIFEVSTNCVNISGMDGRLTLGGDIVVTGGSGTYTYHWYTPSGESLSTAETLTVDAPGKYLLDITDTCDCLQTVEFNVETTGVSGIEMSPDALSPNPTSGPVKVRGFDAVQIAAVSMSGSLEALVDLEGRVITEVDFSNLPEGLHIVTLTDTRGRTAVTKLMKK